MTVFRCPTCGEPFDQEATCAMPFCSERCRLLDLGRWLDEQQGLPVEPEDCEEE
jgi:endogenous inhibitor of DNA gyrase (YacG/DUF329 family)